MSDATQAKIEILENEKKLLRKLHFPVFTHSSQKIIVLSSMYNECFDGLWNGNGKTTEAKRHFLGYTKNVVAILKKTARWDLNEDVRWYATLFSERMERSGKGLFENTEFERAYPYYKETREMDRQRREEDPPEDSFWAESRIAYDCHRRQDLWTVFASAVETKRRDLESKAQDDVSWDAARKDFNQRNGWHLLRNLVRRLSGHPEENLG